MRVPTRIKGLWNAAYVLLMFTALFWAGNSVVGRAIRDAVPPVALAFWRWTLALLIVIGFAWPHLRRDLPHLKRHWRITALLSLLGIAAFNTLLYTGLHYTTALNSLLMQSAQPPLILFLAYLMFRERTGPLQLVGVLLSLTGVAVIVTQGDLTALLALRLNLGDGLILVAVLLYSLYSVLLRHRPDVHPLSFVAVTFALGALFILPFYVAELLAGARIKPGGATVAAIAYVAIFPSLVAYLFYNRGVELIGPGRAGQILNLMPAFGAVLAMLFLGERLYAFHIAGMILIGVGIALATRRKAQAG